MGVGELNTVQPQGAGGSWHGNVWNGTNTRERLIIILYRLGGGDRGEPVTVDMQYPRRLWRELPPQLYRKVVERICICRYSWWEYLAYIIKVLTIMIIFYVI